MRPFRKHVAIAIDGGGIRGVMVTKALETLQNHLGKPLGDVFQLAAGTSTGSIIAAGIALNLGAAEMTTMYRTLAPKIFAKTWRYFLWPFVNHRYPNDELRHQFDLHSQNKRMGDLWSETRQFDLVIVARDLCEARTRFIKSWKPEYQTMPITTAVLASAAAPTYFPVVEGRYVDGGVGSFGNPCFIAAYEALVYRQWDLKETTLISLGTGKPAPGTHGIPLHAAERYNLVGWVPLLIDSFMNDANDQQARVVHKFFEGLDFRRFQIVTDPIGMDAHSQVDRLIEYGERLGQMILDDQTDPDLDVTVYRA